jgi:hypothetical protein
MVLQKRLEQQFEKLIRDGVEIKSTKKTSSSSNPQVLVIPTTYVDGERARVWAMSALTLVESVFGKDSHYYTEIKNKLQNLAVYQVFAIVLACVQSALESLQNGYTHPVSELSLLAS